MSSRPRLVGDCLKISIILYTVDKPAAHVFEQAAS